jgi:FkbM family methyltransferase
MAGVIEGQAVRYHRRSLSAAVRAIMKPDNYIGFARVLARCSSPFDFLKRYMGSRGSYPTSFQVRTPTGNVPLTAYTPDDVLTINEIFFRGDYGTEVNDRVVVDFGSNIGVSATYFLSSNRGAFVYCYEPVPQNVGRLRQQLEAFPDRYQIEEVAVAPQDGPVTFMWEPTGRYGGIGMANGEPMTVTGMDSNSILERVIAERGQIDLLKIDIESLEFETVSRIPEYMARKIKRVIAEFRFTENPLSATHKMSFKAPITTFRLRAH